MGLRRIIGKGMAAALLGALVVACSHSNEPVQEPGPPAVARPAARPRARVVLAVPPLLGLSVDSLARKLGARQSIPAPVQAQLSQLPNAIPSDSTRFFRVRSLAVLVSYDADTRQLNDLLLLGANEDLLMERAGLVADATNYLLLPVFYARRPTQLLGLRVVPLDPAALRAGGR